MCKLNDRRMKPTSTKFIYRMDILLQNVVEKNGDSEEYSHDEEVVDVAWHNLTIV